MSRHPERGAPGGHLVLTIGVLAYSAAAAWVATGTYLHMIASYSNLALPMLVGALLLLGAQNAVRLRAGRPADLSGLRRAVLAIAAFCISLAAFTRLKLAIPSHVPFYLDPFLARADLWLHGAHPGEVLHRLVPGPVAQLLPLLYGQVWLILWVGCMPLVAVLAPAPLRERYAWAMLLSFVLIGTVLATALSSVGPIFYDRFYEDSPYAGLLAAIDASAIGPRMRSISRYLYENYVNRGNAVGTGISAMPSVHLVVVTRNAWMLTSLHRALGALAWAFAATILAGSVYLGFHYALDGYVSILLASGIWWACGRRQAVAEPLRRAVARLRAADDALGAAHGRDIARRG